MGGNVVVKFAKERSEAELTEAREFEAYNSSIAFSPQDLDALFARQTLMVAKFGEMVKWPGSVVRLTPLAVEQTTIPNTAQVQV